MVQLACAIVEAVCALVAALVEGVATLIGLASATTVANERARSAGVQLFRAVGVYVVAPITVLYAVFVVPGWFREPSLTERVVSAAVSAAIDKAVEICKERAESDDGQC